ncbi:HAD family hydrolase [Lachnospiraceae bacterium LCP25S3_G4]
MLKYNTYIFDIDGTLINSEFLILNALQKTLKEILNKQYDLHDLQFCLGLPLSESMKILTGDRWAEAIQIGKKYYQPDETNIPIFPGIEDTLRTLKARDCKLGIVTSKTRMQYEHSFANYPIASLFDCSICQDEALLHKPDPSPLLLCMEQLKSTARSTIYIGDTSNDLACAKSAHVDSALVLWGLEKPKELGATWRLHTPQDLLKFKRT